ncbi:MAG: conjugal transfer protein TraX [Clostridiales bacterium]|nr:conjugal transfer protein TraX [Clostridiales bacterium]
MNKIASRFKILNSEHLKIIGMICMLCDHLGATLLPWIDALGLIGRIAFPIFAFQMVNIQCKCNSQKDEKE